MVAAARQGVHAALLAYQEDRSSHRGGRGRQACSPSTAEDCCLVQVGDATASRRDARQDGSRVRCAVPASPASRSPLDALVFRRKPGEEGTFQSQIRRNLAVRLQLLGNQWPASQDGSWCDPARHASATTGRLPPPAARRRLGILGGSSGVSHAYSHGVTGAILGSASCRCICYVDRYVARDGDLRSQFVANRTVSSHGN